MHRCTGTLVQSPGKPRARQSPSHTPAKNTAFSSCGASYTASIFSGSSGQNVATSKGPIGLFCGVTVRQMNLGWGAEDKGNHTFRHSAAVPTYASPNPLKIFPVVVSPEGVARSKAHLRGTGEWTEPPLQDARAEKPGFCSLSCSPLQEDFPNYLCLYHSLPPLRLLTLSALE